MIQLSEEQIKAKDAILEFLLDSDQHFFVLQGTAGTGKTTLIKEVSKEWANQQQLLKTLDPKYLFTKFASTATTNKAVQALTNATGYFARTIHQFLGLTVRNGQVALATQSEPNFVNTVIVIDECSYIDYRLLEMIESFTKDNKVIFMGDKTQLPPVGYNHSPVFYKEYPTFNLTKQLRQMHSPNIAKYCRDLQAFINTPVDFPALNIGNEIEHLSKDDFNKRILQMDATKSKILAIKNRTVNNYNAVLFKAKNGREEFAAKDVVINNHYVPGLATDEEVTIEHIRYGINRVGVAGATVVINGKHYFLPSKVSNIKKLIKQYTAMGEYSKANVIKNTWVDLRPNFALTVHKSQGSTYDEVFIDLDDMKSIKDLRELAKLLYVAMSRAKYRVILTGDIR